MEAWRVKADRYILYRSSVTVLLFDEEGVDLSYLVGDAIDRIQHYMLSHRQVYFQHGIVAVTFVPALAADTSLPDDPRHRMDRLVNDEQLCDETELSSIGSDGPELAAAFCDWRAANARWRTSIAGLPDVWWPIPGALFDATVPDDSRQNRWYLSDACIAAVATTPDLYRLVHLPLLTVASERTFLPREVHVIEGAVVQRAEPIQPRLPMGREHANVLTDEP